MVKQTVIVVTAFAILVSAYPATAQRTEKVYRIGYISNRYKIEYREEALRQGLREHGYVEGENIIFEWRFAEGKRSRLGEFAAELVRRKVDCIVTSGVGSTRAAKKATGKVPIPIVMANLFDPVRAGIVSDLARPGGNITGFTTRSVDMAGKLLGLLKDALPRLTHVVLLVEQAHPNNPSAVEESQVAARKIGVRLQVIEVGSNEFESAFRTAKHERADAVIVRGTGLMHRNRTRIAKLEAETKLPVMYTERRFVAAGGLMSYGVDRADPYRRAGAYLDKILKGTKPGDLPIQGPLKFDLVINMKTAEAAGITFSQSFLLRATELIE